MKKIITIFIALIMVLSTAIPAFAENESMVEYNNASEFIFNPDSTDLFQNFKGVMPGDRTQQNIVIKNTKASTPVQIYMRAEIDEEYKDFLDQIDLDVYCVSPKTNQKQLIQSGKASEEGRLLLDVSLGTYKPNEEGLITVEIYVHPEMNNDYKNYAGKIKWIFSVEEGEHIYEKPTEPDVDEPTPDGVISGHVDRPQTGVTIAGGIIALCVAVGAFVILIIARKKPKEDEEK